ncbi:L domain-like protein [Rhizoclosmatium globosum]|uniref:L domain-like protein n=1 Tax=Rhizoclosmatium globosum TaxID=329046 RepID=A0A1Y2CDQ9_9FUNG|nr:L domain-like protein [Rhizoclosmatium globosum]|eukprot:ORY45162.1 L domain-like protein [Rhizoclosmatium globosum]
MRFLTDLRYLEITNCKYEGLFPEVLFSLMVTAFEFREHIAVWSTFSFVGSLTNLRLLILRGTSLSGSIPSEIGNLVNLRNLCLEKSQFSGTIPSSIGMLTLLHTLILKSNKLEGNVPRELLNLTLLHTCDLRFNEGLSCDFEFPLLQLGNDKDVDKSDDESDDDDELSDGFGN